MSGEVAFSVQKERIYSLIKMKGPSLPVQIARGIGVSPLFAGAFLSELYADKKIKISNMRVGSSPLYYIEGQESMLESFVEHLNIREKEAFYLLKKVGVLDDDTQTPVIRVALREIKDFAIPVKAKFNDNVKTFWRHFLLSEQDARLKIQGVLNPEFVVENKKEEKIAAKKEERPVEISVAPVISSVEHKKVEVKADSKDIKKEEKVKKKSVKKESKKVNIQDNLFSKKIRAHLSAKDVEILETILDKKKEFIGKVRIDMMFGKQEFFLVAKDKKIISDNDLTVALQNAQSVRMPVLVVSSGELNKKAQEYMKEWRNLIRFERVKV